MYSSIYEQLLFDITILTVLVQIYVIWLVQKKSPYSMFEYRFFLNLFTLFDMLFTILMGIFLQPDSVPNMLASWCRGLSLLAGPQAALYTLGAVIYAGSNAVLTQNYCLMYRFTIIHNNRNVHAVFMSTKCKVLWFSIEQAISLALGILMYFSCVQPKNLPGRIGGLSPEFQRILNPQEFIFWIDIEMTITHVFMYIMLFLFVVVESSCIALVYLILSTLKRKASLFSRNTYRLHFQLTTLLTVQLLTPLIFIIIPVALCLVLAFMGQFSPQAAGRAGFLFINVYSLVNALCTIVFITPYKSHAYGCFSRWFPRIARFLNKKKPKRTTVSEVHSMPWITKAPS